MIIAWRALHLLCVSHACVCMVSYIPYAYCKRYCKHSASLQLTTFAGRTELSFPRELLLGTRGVHIVSIRDTSPHQEELGAFRLRCVVQESSHVVLELLQPHIRPSVRISTGCALLSQLLLHRGLYCAVPEYLYSHSACVCI
jgi:hypothetical protein